MPGLFGEILELMAERGRKGGPKGMPRPNPTSNPNPSPSPSPSPSEKFGGKVRIAMELGNMAAEASEYYKTRPGGSMPAVEAFCANIQKYLKHPEKWMGAFQAFAAGSLTMGVMQVLQGSAALEQVGIKIHGELQAHTGLDAPKKFSEIALHYLESETSTVHGDALDHLYFLYHPDTDWHGYFWHRMRGRAAAFPDNFLGMSEHLELLCAFMLFTRRHLRRSKRAARFHLLIPSYRPLAVTQPYVFSDELYPLTIHGVRHDAQTRVWLNLPGAVDAPPDRLELKDVENLAALPAPPNLWQQACDFLDGLFTPPKPPEPILLGVAAPADDGSVDGAAAANDEGGDGEFTKQPQTRKVTRRRKHSRRQS